MAAARHRPARRVSSSRTPGRQRSRPERRRPPGPVTPVPGRSPGLGARASRARSEGEGESPNGEQPDPDRAGGRVRTPSPSARPHRGSAGATRGGDAAGPVPVESRSRAERSQARSRVSPVSGGCTRPDPAPRSCPVRRASDATERAKARARQDRDAGRRARSPRSPHRTYGRHTPGFRRIAGRADSRIASRPNSRIPGGVKGRGRSANPEATSTAAEQSEVRSAARLAGAVRPRTFTVLLAGADEHHAQTSRASRPPNAPRLGTASTIAIGADATREAGIVSS